MPDIREILNALDENDRTLWSKHRTEMRKSYMTAHNAVMGVASWDMQDDAFIDLIDIKLALLFDKSGRFDTHKELIGNEGEKIEKEIVEASDKLKLQPPAGWKEKQNG